MSRGRSKRAGEPQVDGTTDPSAAPEAQGPSFETSAERLAGIVETLESGELSLDESLKLFEEGVRVARAAQQRLDRAERRVEELLGLDERGEPVTRPLDEQEE